MLASKLIAIWNKIIGVNSKINTEITNRTNADNNLQTQINNIKQFITYKANDEVSGLAYSQANPDVFVYWEE